MRRNNSSGDLSRKLVNRSLTGPSRVSALAVNRQFSVTLPFTKNAKRPFNEESYGSGPFWPSSVVAAALVLSFEKVKSATAKYNRSLRLKSRSRRYSEPL